MAPFFKPAPGEDPDNEQNSPEQFSESEDGQDISPLSDQASAADNADQDQSLTTSELAEINDSSLNVSTTDDDDEDAYIIAAAAAAEAAEAAAAAEAAEAAAAAEAAEAAEEAAEDVVPDEELERNRTMGM